MMDDNASYTAWMGDNQSGDDCEVRKSGHDILYRIVTLRLKVECKIKINVQTTRLVSVVSLP